jgi:hypothetical protein
MQPMDNWVAETVNASATALGNMKTEVPFTGENITYRNMRYLFLTKDQRKQADAAGHGLKATSPDYAGSLTRCMTTAMRSVEDPWSRLIAIAQDSDKAKLAGVHKAYIAYRDAHCPDFAQLYARLSRFGDATITTVTRRFDAQRAACEATGQTWNEDACIADDDSVLNPDDPHPVTARQFSDDFAKMFGYIQKLGAHVAELAQDFKGGAAGS